MSLTMYPQREEILLEAATTARSTWQLDFATAMPGLSVLPLKCSCFSFSTYCQNRLAGKKYVLKVRNTTAWAFINNGRGQRKQLL